MYIWRLPVGMELTRDAAVGVELLLKPAAIFSELDVFGIEESDHYPEDEYSSDTDLSDLVPNHVFDADSFYERV